MEEVIKLFYQNNQEILKLHQLYDIITGAPE